MTTPTENSAIARRAVTCARCGVHFECGLSEQCWCAAEPCRLPMSTAEDCQCPACLRQAAKELAAAALASNTPR